MTATTEPPQEPQLEKPKRNWRGFLKEYAVIVIGVLTALAAQQAAEWLHWQGEVKAARTALRVEMSDAAAFYRIRVDVATCVDKKLDSIAAGIAEVAAGRQPDLNGIVFSGLGYPVFDSEWQSQRSSQVLTHFPRQELALMNAFYGQMGDIHDWVQEENVAWTHLATLQEAAQKLGPADLAQLRANYHLARRYQGLIVRNSRRLLEVAAQLKVKPAALTPDQIVDRCNLDRARF
jgi:hypothetical protein